MPYKIYANFESTLKRLWKDKGSNASYTKKYQAHIPCSFAYKVVCIDDLFNKSVFLYRGKNAVNKFIKTILNEYDYCKLMMKKHFNENFVMTVEDERSFKSGSKMQWIVY